MNIKEFKKLITVEPLAKIDESAGIMFKAYFSCLLEGGKVWETCYISSVRTWSGLIPQKCVDWEVRRGTEDLVKLFKQLKEQGFWEVVELSETYYDRRGDGPYYDKEDVPMKAISKIVFTQTKTTNYLNKPVKIKPYKVKK